MKRIAKIIILFVLLLFVFDFPLFNKYEDDAFQIKRGENVFQVSANLKNKGHIKSKILFLIESLRNKNYSKLKAGNYSLGENISNEEIIDIFANLARKARREGLLGLEDDIERLEDPFYQKGIRLMVDALDPDLIKDILETEMHYTGERHELGQRVFKTWGGLAPAFGMIGTLIGLIQMLAKLDDPSSLGPAMALALLTTFYGSLLANLILLPMAGKLELRSEQELLAKELILEGVIGIQSGMNPRILEEKLKAFIGPKLLPKKEGQLEGEAVTS